METYFSKQVQELYEKSLEIISHTSMLKAIRTHELVDVEISQNFKEAFLD